MSEKDNKNQDSKDKTNEDTDQNKGKRKGRLGKKRVVKKLQD